MDARSDHCDVSPQGLAARARLPPTSLNCVLAVPASVFCRRATPIFWLCTPAPALDERQGAERRRGRCSPERWPLTQLYVLDQFTFSF